MLTSTGNSAWIARAHRRARLLEKGHTWRARRSRREDGADHQRVADQLESGDPSLNIQAGGPGGRGLAPLKHSEG
jgi:hypothetical protein